MKKGFTLIELLVTIVIIAILSGMAVVAYNALFKTGKERYYENLESNIMLASDDYFSDHRGKKEVKLGDLVDRKYLEPVKDADGNATCTKESKVIMYRENGVKKYAVCIECGGYKSNNEMCNME